MDAQIITVNKKLISVDCNMSRIEKILKPIKTKVNNMSETVSWIKSIPTSIKVISSIIIFITTLVGAYSVGGGFIKLLVK